jgi:hypothetical protein
MLGLVGSVRVTRLSLVENTAMLMYQHCISGLVCRCVLSLLRHLVTPRLLQLL